MRKRSRLLGMFCALGMLTTGCSWGMESLSPRSQEMCELRRYVSEKETDCIFKSYEDCGGNPDLEKTCELLKVAFLGTGESEFSKRLIETVKEDVEKFSKSEEAISGISSRAEEFFSKNVRYEFISRFLFLSYTSLLGKRLLILAEQKLSRKEREEAIRLKNEAIFWLLFGIKRGDCLEKDTEIRLRKLGEALR